MHTSIVRSVVKETQFGLYTDSELRTLSVCKIVSPLARDSLGNALSGGLYDPRMGATQQGQQCPTCLTHYIGCPGHPGHIELDFPVYHPLLFASLFQLVKSACFCCHRLRMSSSRLTAYLAKLQLLEMGDVKGAETLDDRLLPVSDVLQNTDEEPSSKKVAVAKSKESKERATHDAEVILGDIDKRYRAFAKADARNKGTRKAISMHAKQMQRAVVSELSRELVKVKKCEHCGEHSPSVRKDGHAKVFSKPLPKKYIRRSGKNNALYGRRTALEEVRYLAARMAKRQQQLESGMEVDSEEEVTELDAIDPTLDVDSDEDVNDNSEEDEESSDSDSDNEHAKKPVVKKNSVPASVVEPGKESDKYLVPLEVEATLQLLWKYHANVLDFVWGRATRGDRASVSVDTEGWRLFFLRAILVPPSRFRPEAHIGDAVSDHPQNAHLSKIIETNDAIRKLALERSGAQMERSSAEVAQTGLRSLIANGASQSQNHGQPIVAEILAKTIASSNEPSFLSKSIQLWIQLQTSVNCYMDSAKDPNPLGGTTVPAGIRQLLEKKEGIFRMNMMGKRVNYCCRSVISPDNNLGVNEIGIPVKFAKTLHYPTPVNEINAKHLRMLVERGPHQYPGKFCYHHLLF